MKPPRTLGLHPTPEAIQRHLEYVSKTLSNISFGSTTSNADGDMNLNVWKATGTAPGIANTEFAVTHNLKRIPIGFLVASVAPSGVIYKSTTAWTAATNSALGSIFLKCNTPSVAFTIIVI